MIALLEKNCFIKGASRIKEIKISSKIIIGHLMPFLIYLKSTPNILESFSIEIRNIFVDLNYIILQILKDKSELLN